MASNKQHLVFDSEARKLLIDGVNKLSKAVGSTLGPKGRNVLIQNAYGLPHLTKDGVTVAKAVELENPVAQLGVELARQAASETVSQAGDGTTTATILTSSIINKAAAHIDNGANPIDIKIGIEAAADYVVKELEKLSIPVNKSLEKIKQVATISTNNDTKLGDLISQAMSIAGEDGVITVAESKSTETSIAQTAGLEFDRGYLSPHFINNFDKMTVELESPYILIYDKKLRSSQEIIPAMEIALQQRKPLLVIGDEVEAQALGILVVNKLKAGIEVAAVKAPSFGDNRLKVLQDIATLTGGEVLTELAGDKPTQVQVHQLGKAEKIIISRDSTTIINGAGTSEAVENRIKTIKAEMEQEESEYMKNQCAKRIAALKGGVVTIHIGAYTDSELKETKDRVDDAIHATKAAVQEGIVPGAGTTFLKIYKNYMATPNKWKGSNKDQQTGFEILIKSLRHPTFLISQNAGKEGIAIVEEVLAGLDKNSNYGFDANNDTFVDLLKKGIIDPAKVLRVAIQNASSAAKMILMTNTVITKDQELDLPSQGMY